MNTTSLTPFNGSDYDHGRDAPRLTDQMNRVFNVLSDKRWHTLEEIAAITGDPTPSVSAQIRHLRKARFGGWDIQKIHQHGGLFSYRFTGEKTTPASESTENCAPLPPAAPELLEMAHRKISQLKGELELAGAKRDELAAALQLIVWAQPAGGYNGETCYERFDGDGNHIGSEHVDPLSVMAHMVDLAQTALDRCAQLDAQISP